MADYTEDDRFHGAHIHRCDLAGLEIRDCDLSGMKITDCWGSVLHVDGYFDRVFLNDVDVSAYVDAELDRRHPVRVLARDAASPDGFRAAWDVIETLWAATLDRARRLPAAELHQRVGGEWSLVDTQRHLLFAGDAWLGNAVLEEHHTTRWAFQPSPGSRPTRRPSSGSLRSHSDARRGARTRLARMATMRHVVEGLTGSELDRLCSRKPAEPYPDQGVRRARLPQGGAERGSRALPLYGATSECSRTQRQTVSVRTQ